MSKEINDNSILNNPYHEPNLYYDTDNNGEIDYTRICEGRRMFKPDLPSIPNKQKGQKQMFGWNEDTPDSANHLINLIRKEIGIWRSKNYPDTTRVTKELLDFWFNNPQKFSEQKLFFAQQEAIETAIWLNEVAEKSTPGKRILEKLREGQQTVGSNPIDQLPRIAFKMATGTGKTVVMACFILYHYFNRKEYKHKDEPRFADYFLIVAPGITIKDRLNVLFVDTQNKNPQENQDYYAARYLVPRNLEPQLAGINACLHITNYHNFEPKALKGNKKTPFDGKMGSKKEDYTEDFSQVVKRVFSKFKRGTRLLVMNDEAHHCYLPNTTGKTTDNEEVDENARAAIWFSGLRELAKRFKLQNVYDLSATPYYLSGSGHKPYSLFPWVVSDFGLIEAIESGLVKIPFLPESDNTQNLSDGEEKIDQAMLCDLYQHVKVDLPKKGQKKQKTEANADGKVLKEQTPRIPSLIKGALDQFYNHYADYDKGARKQQEEYPNLYAPPPVFIVVCNNTSVSKEMYKYIAGYEYTNENNERIVYPGMIDLFNNYDQYNRPKQKPPTLLIDSNALEDNDQVNDDFKQIFAAEIEVFKQEYARTHGQGSSEKITDAEILREVVNTVGRQGKLGAHIRCVVSVSMLTEGWDSNTVTHIMGLRAFGSQLLCEQVAGRALRRMKYYLKTYRKDTGEEVLPQNKHRFKPENLIEKFPPEYAHIIGIPFKLFKKGKPSTGGGTPTNLKYVRAVPEREKTMEITFPNVVAYRTECYTKELQYDFSNVADFELICSKFPHTTITGSAFVDVEQILKVQSVFEKREQEIQFFLTNELINYHFSDDEHNPEFQLFGKLLSIVKYWYNNKVRLVGENDAKFKKLLFFEDIKAVVAHINQGINPQLNTTEYIRPTFNYYNPFGSTKYVSGITAKEVYLTTKSHVNYVVMDSDWEAFAAQTFETMPQVQTYVKNNFLDFAIPYIKDNKERQYYPDFILRIITPKQQIINLIVEITGMNKEKNEKKWFVEYRWLPAVNALREKYNYPQWHFIEITDILDIKNALTNFIDTLA